MSSLSKLIVPSSWPATANACTDAAHEATKALALTLELITPDQIQRFDASRFALLSSFAYPNATLERFKICNDWLVWLFFFDDQADDQTDLGQCPLTLRDYMEACLAVLRTGAMRPNPTGLELFTLNIRNRMLPIASDAWLLRFADDVEDYLYKGTLKAADNWMRGTTPDVEPYLLQRQYDSAVYTCQDLIEITAEGLELPAEILSDARCQTLRRLCTQVVAFTNDIFSYEKEVLKHRNPNNILDVLMLRRSLPLTEATSQAVGLINNAIESFIAHEQDLQPEIRGDKRLHAYVHGMKAWMRGNLLWSVLTGRYRSPTSPFPEIRSEYVSAQASPTQRRWSSIQNAA
ncbi:MAG: terpene synthase family protein [Gammaproteobacteria bacterium]